MDSKAAAEGTTEDLVSADSVGQRSEAVESVANQMNKLAVSATTRLVGPPSDPTESSNPGGPGFDLDKKIRTLKKKVFLSTSVTFHAIFLVHAYAVS